MLERDYEDGTLTRRKDWVKIGDRVRANLVRDRKDAMVGTVYRITVSCGKHYATVQWPKSVGRHQISLLHKVSEVMPRLTINRVNAAIAEAGMTEIELVAGRGYFYFTGRLLYLFSGVSSGVYVYRLNDLSLEEWVAEARERWGGSEWSEEKQKWVAVRYTRSGEKKVGGEALLFPLR